MTSETQQGELEKSSVRSHDEGLDKMQKERETGQSKGETRANTYLSY